MNREQSCEAGSIICARLRTFLPHLAAAARPLRMVRALSHPIFFARSGFDSMLVDKVSRGSVG